MDATASQIDALRTSSLASVLTEALERLVLGGEIAAGERLNENQLAARFGVSRGPIREAVRALEGAGLVVSVPNRGVYVRRLTMREVRELYDVRAALFGLAGRLMAERASDADVAHLKNLLRAMETATQNHDFDAYYPLNLEFHAAIVDGSGNATLAGQYRAFVRKLNLFRARSLVQGGGLHVSNREHREMVEAIEARDPAWAHEAHWRHVAQARDRLLAVIRAERKAEDTDQDNQSSAANDAAIHQPGGTGDAYTP